MNYTSIEQSKKLLELGLNPESADMYFNIAPDEDYCIELIQDNGFIYHQFKKTEDFNDCQYLPCWSLGSLLELMPSEIYPKDTELKCWGYCPIIEKCHHTYDGMDLGDSFFVRYQNSEDGDIIIYKEFEKDDLIDSVFDCMVWLLENRYIK